MVYRVVEDENFRASDEIRVSINAYNKLNINSVGCKLIREKGYKYFQILLDEENQMMAIKFYVDEETAYRKLGFNAAANSCTLTIFKAMNLIKCKGKINKNILAIWEEEGEMLEFSYKGITPLELT